MLNQLRIPRIFGVRHISKHTVLMDIHIVVRTCSIVVVAAENVENVSISTIEKYPKNEDTDLEPQNTNQGDRALPIAHGDMNTP